MTSRLGAIVILLIFLGAMFGGLYHMTMGMDIAGEESDCLFMTAKEKLCSMSLSEHFVVWQSVFTAIIPGLLLLLVAFAVIAVVMSIAPHLLIRKLCELSTLAREIQERMHSFSWRYLQELFSDGILHPKLF